MTNERDEAELHAMLSALLDRYAGALILVKDEHDDVKVLCGGSAYQDDGRDLERYREIVKTAPGIVATWSRLVMEDEVPAPRRAN